MSAVDKRSMFHRERAIRAGAALVMLGGAAAVTYLWAGPDTGERGKLSTAEQTGAMTASEPAGHLASAISFPTASTQQVELGRPIAASAAIPAPGVGASAAMQDYGQIVIAALHGGTPKQAGEAAKLIASCQFANEGRDFVESLKSKGHVYGEAAVSMTARAEQRLRRCQSITPDMKSRTAELAERGLLSGMKGLGDIYGRAVDYAPPPSMRKPLIEALRADFLDGQSLSAYMLARHGPSLGLSRIEAHAYEIAFATLEKRMNEAMNPDGLRSEAPPLTEEEVHQAQTLAQTWLSNVRKDKDPS
jgi:hypothetical protein